MDTKGKRITALRQALIEVDNNKGENIDHIYSLCRNLHDIEASGVKLSLREDNLWDDLTIALLRLEDQRQHFQTKIRRISSK